VVGREARRSEMQVMFAVRVRLVRSSLGPASTCIEDLRERTSSVASCSARPQQSYRVCHRRLESWTSSQERRGLCQAPDTTSASRAQKVEDGTSSVSARKHTARKLEGTRKSQQASEALDSARAKAGTVLNFIPAFSYFSTEAITCIVTLRTLKPYIILLYSKS
jgi:hypothetical protein